MPPASPPPPVLDPPAPMVPMPPAAAPMPPLPIPAVAVRPPVEVPPVSLAPPLAAATFPPRAPPAAPAWPLTEEPPVPTTEMPAPPPWPLIPAPSSSGSGPPPDLDVALQAMTNSTGIAKQATAPHAESCRGRTGLFILGPGGTRSPIPSARAGGARRSLEQTKTRSHKPLCTCAIPERLPTGSRDGPYGQSTVKVTPRDLNVSMFCACAVQSIGLAPSAIVGWSKREMLATNGERSVI